MSNANPRFPHKIKVSRTTVNRDVNPPTSVTAKFFEGECRNFPSKSGGTGITDGAFVSDYMVSMPPNEVEFKTGDTVEITDNIKTFAGVIVNSYNGNLGCIIWHNGLSK